jgi:hypothetical protein
MRLAGPDLGAMMCPGKLDGVKICANCEDNTVVSILVLAELI